MRIRGCWLTAVIVVGCACKAHDDKAAAAPDDLQRQAAEAALAAARAQAAVHPVEDEAKQAQDTVAQLARDSAALDAELDRAEHMLTGAATDADRTAAQALLLEIKQQRLELEQRIAAAMAAAGPPRSRGVHLSKECLDNPLQKGCP